MHSWVKAFESLRDTGFGIDSLSVCNLAGVAASHFLSRSRRQYWGRSELDCLNGSRGNEKLGPMPLRVREYHDNSVNDGNDSDQ